MKLFDKLNKLKKNEDFNFGMSDIIGSKSSVKTEQQAEAQGDKALAEMVNSIPVTPNNSLPSSNSVQAQTAQQPYASPLYGIQETIELIRSLPVATPEVVIPVVIRTLESAKINVNDIITDAAQREEVIESRSVDLINNIEMLEAKIAQLNDEVMALNTELEDIANVKNLLLSALLEENEEADEEPAQKASSQAAQAAASAKKNAHIENDPETAELEDAEFDDIDIDQALNEVSKIHIAQEA